MKKICLFLCLYFFSAASYAAWVLIEKQTFSLSTQNYVSSSTEYYDDARIEYVGDYYFVWLLNDRDYDGRRTSEIHHIAIDCANRSISLIAVTEYDAAMGEGNSRILYSGNPNDWTSLPSDDPMLPVIGKICNQ